MDFGTLIAFGALCILAVPAVLLLVDLPKKQTPIINQQERLTSEISVNESRVNDSIDSNSNTEKKEKEDNLSETDLNNKEVIPVEDSNTQHNITGWRCACEGGFLPPGLLQNFSGAEAVLRMSAGRCYHKKGV